MTHSRKIIQYVVCHCDVIWSSNMWNFHTYSTGIPILWNAYLLAIWLEILFFGCIYMSVFFSFVALLMVINFIQSILSGKVNEGAVRSTSWLNAANMDM